MPASPNSLTQGRDLAQGTGQPAEWPEAPAEQELAFARTQLSTIPRTGRFSPAQTDADDAPAIDRPSPVLSALSARIDLVIASRSGFGSVELSAYRR